MNEAAEKERVNHNGHMLMPFQWISPAKHFVKSGFLPLLQCLIIEPLNPYRTDDEANEVANVHTKVFLYLIAVYRASIRWMGHFLYWLDSCVVFFRVLKPLHAGRGRMVAML